MEQRIRSIVITILATCLVIVGFTVHGYPSQESKEIQDPQTQKPSRPNRLPARPARYPTALAGLEVLADLSVSQASHDGSCPAVFTFKGKITVNRPVTVQYRFIRSDNSRHNLGVLTFDEAGTKEVTDTWVFDDPAQLPTFKGWEAIQINLPMKFRSNLAYISGTCTDYKGGPPTPQPSNLQESAQGPVPGPRSKSTLSWPQPDPQLPPVKR